MNPGNTDLIPFQEWYEENKYSFPDYLIESIEENIDFLFFLQNIYRPFEAAAWPKVNELMLNHYPVFRTETRNIVLLRIKDIVNTVVLTIIFKTYELMQDKFVNIDVHDKYPEFEEWRKTYTARRTPESISEDSRDDYPYLSYEQWVEYRNEENKIFIQYFNWYENRFKQFRDLLNSMLEKYYPQISILGEDERVMLIVHVFDNYELFKSECEQIELFIDCGFPENDVLLDFKEFTEKYSKLSKEMKQYTDSLRLRRIRGEKI